LSKYLIEKWNSQKGNSRIVNELSKALSKINFKTRHQKAETIHKEVFEEVDCLQCANCCKSIPPIVSSRDSKRISKYLNLRKSDFEERYLVTDEDGDQVINTSPCPFLENDNKCRIYDVRPSACRQYPHTGDEGFFKHLSLHKRNVKYCPALFEIMLRLKEVK